MGAASLATDAQLDVRLALFELSFLDPEWLRSEVVCMSLMSTVAVSCWREWCSLATWVSRGTANLSSRGLL